MDAQEMLFYGFGQVCLSIAKADGKVQLEEKDKLHNLIIKHLDQFGWDFNITEIIFKISNEDPDDYEYTYEQGIKNMELGSHHLTSEVAQAFKSIIADIASVFTPITRTENKILKRFKADLERFGVNDT